MENKHTKTNKKLYITLLITLVVLFTASILFLHKYYIKYSFQNTSLQETNCDISNPYCGFYGLYAYELSESPIVDTTKWCQEVYEKDNYSFLLLEINLKKYNSEALSSNALSQLQYILNYFSQNNSQIILRFVYDWSGNAKSTEPSSVSLVQQHIQQTAEIVNQYKEHVYIIQGVFLGDYGEMHDGNYIIENEMSSLLALMAASYDSEIYLAVRTPCQWRTVTKQNDPLSKEDAFMPTLNARLSLFNDGMLASYSDFGTYLEEGDDEFANGQWARKKELNFQNRLCNYVPNGGEAIVDNSYNDFINACNDLQKMHVSYLNNMYDEKVLSKWENSTYHGNDVFNGMNGYDYIRLHLGYRYYAGNCTLSFQPLFDKYASLDFSIYNSGFASCYKQLDGYVTLTNTLTKEKTILKIPYDFRELNSHGCAKIHFDLDIRSMEKGEYSITLHLEDSNTNTTIFLANQQTDNVKLGTLIVE